MNAVYFRLTYYQAMTNYKTKMEKQTHNGDRYSLSVGLEEWVWETGNCTLSPWGSATAGSGLLCTGGGWLPPWLLLLLFTNSRSCCLNTGISGLLKLNSEGLGVEVTGLFC